MRTTDEIKQALYSLRDECRRCNDQMAQAVIEAQIETLTHIEILCRRVQNGEQGTFVDVI